MQVVDDPTQFRLDDVHLMDMRIEKELSFKDVGVTFGVDVFNVLNKSYVQQRQHRLAVAPSLTTLGLNPFTPYADYVTEVTSPRVIRLGVRFSLR